MGLFDFIKKSGNPKPDKRYVTYQRVYNPPGQHIRIIKESLDICMRTVNPDTFFSREKLASNEACYCENEPDIVWNGMNCAQIYKMLNEPKKRDAWHRDFIDRLFERGKEDNLTFHMYDAVISQDTADYFVRKLNGKKYHFCKVGFANSTKLYTYVAKDLSIKPGDSVTIPTGNAFVPDTKLKQVVEVFDASLDELDFSIRDLRCIEEKLKSIVCPHCGAVIEINVGEKLGRCTRCQSEFYLLDYNSDPEPERTVKPNGVPETVSDMDYVPESNVESEKPERTELKEEPEDNRQFSKSVEEAKDQEEEYESEEIEGQDEPERKDETAERNNDSGTYSWDRFYPYHCDDDVVEMMEQEGVRLTQGSGIKPGDLAEALFELEKEKNRLKILKDLKKDGYRTEEKDILEYFGMEGDGKVLNEMIRMFMGTFSKKVFMEFYTYGTDVRLSEMLKKAPPVLDFTESEIIDILNSVDTGDVTGVRELLARYNPRTIKKDTVIEICELLPSSALEVAKKYLKLLPFEDRVEIQDDYF